MEDIKPVRYNLRGRPELKTRGPKKEELQIEGTWVDVLPKPREIHFEVGKFEDSKYKVVYDPVGDPSDSTMSTVAIHGDGTTEFLLDKKSWYQQMLDFVRNVF